MPLFRRSGDSGDSLVSHSRISIPGILFPIASTKTSNQSLLNVRSSFSPRVHSSLVPLTTTILHDLYDTILSKSHNDTVLPDTSPSPRYVRYSSPRYSLYSHVDDTILSDSLDTRHLPLEYFLVSMIRITILQSLVYCLYSQCT